MASRRLWTWAAACPIDLKGLCVWFQNYLKVKKMEHVENLEILLRHEAAFAEPACHGEHRRFFCLDCRTTECESCAKTNHSSCRVVQLRRFLYNTVVRVNDVASLLDGPSPHIRPYIVNGTPSVHLRPKPRDKPSLPDCDRCLGVDCVHGILTGAFCSVACWLSVVTPSSPPISPTLSTNLKFAVRRSTPKFRPRFRHTKLLRKSPFPCRSRFE